jgi:hypothetical protein
MAAAQSGFVRLHRKALDSYLWTMPAEQMKVALTCIALANWKDGETFVATARVRIERGSFVTSLEHLAEHAKVSIRTVRTALGNLESAGFLTRRSTQRFTFLTVVNYDTYNADERETDTTSDRLPTNTRQTADTRPTTIEEGKEGRRKRKPRGSLPEPEPAALALAQKLLSRIRERDPAAKDAAVAWAADIEKLHRLDGRPWAEIDRVLEWSQADHFWRRNILSGGKLREKFPTLVQQAGGRTNGGSHHAPAPLFRDPLDEALAKANGPVWG